MGSAPYSSPLAAELADGVLERFLRYVRIDTQADEDSTTYPSTAKQLDLSRLLVDELRAIGIEELRATIESLLPRPEIKIRALIPYERGDLVNRIHQTGEFLSTEHTAAGTLIAARVNPSLAGELAPYELATNDPARRD